ncbi:luciferin 4-monooxygenase-like [Chironomus tepperi]|uniref:luciferin 4-monooxygenase-like n=1 Tax=Chironomus tepperi TaxID=113505 RepID=UPI00391EF2F6
MSSCTTTYDAENKLWYGPKVNPIYNPNQNLGALILTILHQRGSAVAQISADSGIALTCKQLHDRIVVMAEYLKKCNLQEDDFVGLVVNNSENVMAVAFACYALGIPVCPLSPIMTTLDISKIYEVVKPKLIFCDKSNLATVQEAANDIKSNARIITVMEKVKGYECATEIIKDGDYKAVDNFVPPYVCSEKILGVICSSGSTGTPKRIIKTHRDMINQFFTGWKLPRYRPAVFFTYSPLFWISGFNATIFAVLNYATNVITTQLLVPADEFVDIIQRYRVTYLTTLPFTISNILELKNLKPLETIECWMISGFAATKPLCEKFAPYLPNGEIWVTYGLSETSIVSCNNTGDYTHIGYLNQNCVVKLIDVNGNNVGPNEHGEILIKAEPKFSGYHLDPKKTDEAVPDGWFHTGDIAYFDDQCRLHYVDRKVEIMNYEGYYIIPHEMEALINEVDGVISSSVVGYLEKNSINYIVHAFVVSDETKDINENQIKDHVHGKVIEQRQLRGGVHFVKSFPLGRTGKVDKIKLREMAMKLSA